MAALAGLANVDVLVLDIEGTVCPISFVHDVLVSWDEPIGHDVAYWLGRGDALLLHLYPIPAHPLQPPVPELIPHLRLPSSHTRSTFFPRHLDSHWDSPDFAKYRDAFPADCRNDRAALEAHVRHLVSRDVKAPYLKALQGHLWQQGYESGQLRAPLFPDVAPLITAAHAAGKNIIIYSSGSVPAQKLFFAHTTAQPSDLTPLIAAWFDTVNAGPKTKPASYAAILSSRPHIAPARWLFLSDNLDEVSAALASGMRSLPVTRPGNAPLSPANPLSRLAIPDFAPSPPADSRPASRPCMTRPDRISQAPEWRISAMRSSRADVPPPSVSRPRVQAVKTRHQYSTQQCLSVPVSLLQCDHCRCQRANQARTGRQ